MTPQNNLRKLQAHRAKNKETKKKENGVKTINIALNQPTKEIK